MFALISSVGGGPEYRVRFVLIEPQQARERNRNTLDYYTPQADRPIVWISVTASEPPSTAQISIARTKLRGTTGLLPRLECLHHESIPREESLQVTA